MLNSIMDKKAGKEEGLAEYRHMDELRKWLLGVGFKDGIGLHNVLQTLDAEGVDSVKLLGTCWPRLEPKLKAGPAARIQDGLGKRA